MSEPVVETQDLTVRFGGVLAVNNVNFSLRARELRCLIGPNGAGKSTFFKSITGQLGAAQTSGRVLIRGQDVTGWRTHHVIRLGVGVKTQVPSVMNGLTVIENLWLSAQRTLAAPEAEATVDEMVAELRLQGFARRQVGELAHGQRQLVEIGVVLAGKPWLVLLDEPAAGITSTETERLVAIIKRINETASVIVVDHDMHFVRMLGGRITVFHQGAVLVEGETDTVLADARVREVYLGNRAR
ncbi:MAG TPA: ATP-binding cassette domain-containing protein [Stellaceae bacterium]|nr:ATP-binding cassette domain-containing protein [Stellaceae bacterium]